MKIRQETINRLTNNLAGEVKTDPVSRYLYSTDASIYQIQPMGVIFPKHKDDIHAAVEILRSDKIPILARGAGTSLAGQAVGPAMILDTSRYMFNGIHIDPDRRIAIVQPGVTLANLNRFAKNHGLGFGPDPASADRATTGGSVANNATGAHSILYGMAVDHLLAAEVIMADGRQVRFQTISIAHAEQIGRYSEQIGSSLEARLYTTALQIRSDHAGKITANWPGVWRRASAYNIHYLLPWSPSTPPLWTTWQAHEVADHLIPYPPLPAGEINLAHLIAGSEGTLGVITELELRLVPLPNETALAVLEFDSIAEACNATPGILTLSPSAIELIPGTLIELARSVPAYAHQLSFVSGRPAALLVVEFQGNDLSEAVAKAKRLPAMIIGETPAQKQQIWGIRNMGLGLLNSRPGDMKPIAFIEDLSIPVDRLGYFVREMERIMAEHGTTAEFYAHASAGCLHIRPILNMKSIAGIGALRSIATNAIELTLSLGGAVSGEHGDGLSRSEWIERAFGREVVALFRMIKQAADPDNLMNPGKILDAPPLDANLRFGSEYRTRAWNSVLSFDREMGIDRAIEQCNGAGVCIKQTGVMCPSYQATRSEMHSPRGRANLLRGLITRQFTNNNEVTKAVHEALDLCLACKGCKSECPSAVDIAKLKYEFVHQYYRTHRRRIRDYLFGYFGILTLIGSIFSGVINPLLNQKWLHRLMNKLLGLAAERQAPVFAGMLHRSRLQQQNPIQETNSHQSVIMVSDAFSRYLHPETEADTIQALYLAGLKPILTRTLGTGRTFISKGMLDQAKSHAQRLVSEIKKIDPDGRLPVVGIEPSEIYTLRDEFLDFFPYDSYVKALGQRAWTIEELLIRLDKKDELRIDNQAPRNNSTEKTIHRVWLHGHCYQKTQPPADDGYPVGLEACRILLARAGYQVQEIASGCCGMAGAFGYESEHYQISMDIGELALFPAVRDASDQDIIATSGTSCRAQILDGTGRAAVHPISLIVRS